MITFRPATIHDVNILRYWDTQDHVIACDPSSDWDWENELNRNPAWRDLFIAELNGREIGMVQIIDPQLEETHYWGNIGANKRAIDIWIGEKSDLNKGHGTTMMQMAIEHCFAISDVDEILIDPLESNTKAIRFYNRLGFKVVEKREFDGAQCIVLSLKRPIKPV